MEDVYNTTFTIISDDCIELRKKDNLLEGKYFICSKYDGVVGEIAYRGYHKYGLIGDVGYLVFRDYRKMGYATRSMKLMVDLLIENNVDDFNISVLKDNTPSLEIIEKFTENVVYEDEAMLMYSVDLKTLKKSR